jgi:hypothetical protein
MPTHSMKKTASSRKTPSSPFQVADEAEHVVFTSKQSRNSALRRSAMTTGISPMKLMQIAEERKKSILKLNKLASFA